MSIEKAKNHLSRFGAAQRVLEFDTSSATVELAAQAVGCEPARIAKTLSFRTNGGVILIVTAGDAKVGGVCPFGINSGVTVFLDESLHRFETVFPACGSANSAIELTIPELEQFSGYKAWVDVCKGWREA